MNALIYNLLNKVHGQIQIDDNCLQNLYQFYVNGSKKLNYEIHISKEEFNKIFIIIYDVLRFKINDNEFESVANHYLKLLMADAVDRNMVDYNWFINHIWYFCIGKLNNDSCEKYKDCIMFIQERLIKEFNIDENIKEKIGRKIYTKFMIK